VKLNFVMYTLQLVVRGELSLLSATSTTLMLTQYETSGSTPVMSRVKGASQLRQITLVRFALVRLLTAAGLPEKKILLSVINHSNVIDVNTAAAAGVPTMITLYTVKTLGCVLAYIVGCLSCNSVSCTPINPARSGTAALHEPHANLLDSQTEYSSIHLLLNAGVICVQYSLADVTGIGNVRQLFMCNWNLMNIFYPT